MKNTIISKLMLSIAIAATALAFAACSNDQEPVSPEEGELAELHNRIFYDDDCLLFSPTEDNTYYYTHCPSQEMAIKQIEYYTNTVGINSTGGTYHWQGDNGYFKVSPGNDEGLYYEVLMSLKDFKPFTVAFMHPGYKNSENLSIPKPSGGYMIPFFVWACRKCLTSVPKGNAEYGGTGDAPPTKPCRVCGASDWYRKSVTDPAAP